MKLPKTLAEAIKRIKGDTKVLDDVIKQRDAAEAERDKVREETRTQRDRVQRAERVVDETHKNFADLKERLHNAEMEIARQRGYLDRVREDDAVADPLVEIEGPDGKRLVSKRHPSHGNRRSDYNEMCLQSMGREKQRHWTDY